MGGTGSARNPPAVTPPLYPAMQDRGRSPTLTAEKQRCSCPSMAVHHSKAALPCQIGATLVYAIILCGF